MYLLRSLKLRRLALGSHAFFIKGRRAQGDLSREGVAHRGRYSWIGSCSSLGSLHVHVHVHVCQARLACIVDSLFHVHATEISIFFAYNIFHDKRTGTRAIYMYMYMCTAFQNFFCFFLL